MDGNYGRNPVSPNLAAALARAFLVAGLSFGADRAQTQGIPQPVLAITATSSNSMVVTITNAVSLATYDIETTPVLANSIYPWSVAKTGTTNQTNFVVSIGPYPAGFFRAEVDTNGIPLWEAANPTNPSLGMLTVTIDSPTNGSVLQ